jgi:hypothetical protein
MTNKALQMQMANFFMEIDNKHTKYCMNALYENSYKDADVAKL